MEETQPNADVAEDVNEDGGNSQTSGVLPGEVTEGRLLTDDNEENTNIFGSEGRPEVEDRLSISRNEREPSLFEDNRFANEERKTDEEADIESQPSWIQVEDEEHPQYEDDDPSIIDDTQENPDNIVMQEEIQPNFDVADLEQISDEPAPPLKVIPSVKQLQDVINPAPNKLRVHMMHPSLDFGTAQPAVLMYKAAAPVIREPTIPILQRPCKRQASGVSAPGAKGCSNRQNVEVLRRDLQANRSACNREWQPNPACSVPMRVRCYGGRSRMKAAPEVEEWRIWEERDKERRDHELAKELGYETLVGNILYIDIPGSKDINRSWENFLSDDVMEWGFPYKKGSTERPRMKLPEPYLAHQLKEKLWKFPRSRTFQTTQEE